MRPSSSVPLTCSGDMYEGVPTAIPSLVSASSPSSLAMPKSISFTSPDLVSITFAGLMSRWMIRAKWAWSSADASREPMIATTSGGSGPSRSTEARVGPSTYSITMNSASFFSTRS